MDIVTSDVENLIQNKINFAEKKFGKEFKNILLEIVSLEKMIMLAAAPEKKEPDRFIPLSDWDKFHNYPTVGALRKLHFNRYENGFEDFNVTTKKNGRVLVNEKNYFIWFDNKKNNGEN